MGSSPRGRPRCGVLPTRRSLPGEMKGEAAPALSAGTPLRYPSGAMGIRTPDLLHAMEARYQLRHSPLLGGKLSARSEHFGRRGPRRASSVARGGRHCLFDLNTYQWSLSVGTWT